MLTAPLPAGALDEAHRGALVEAAARLLKGYQVPPFSVGVSWPRPFSEQKRARLKKLFQFPLVRDLQKALHASLEFEEPRCQLCFDLDRGRLSVYLEPVYVLGRYRKLARGVAQTLPYCPSCKGRGCPACKGRGLLEEDSVEALVAAVLVPAFGAAGMKFHGMGREDKDVRMLGRGRPFVAELTDPRKRRANLEALERAINASAGGRITVEELAPARKEDVARIKQARPQKLYGARVACARRPPREAVRALEGRRVRVRQRTPLRVAARRTDAVRVRCAVIRSLKPRGAKTLWLELEADAGLYVKEFISGDGGRTRPSLSSLLGVPCACQALDVLDLLDEPHP